MEALSGLRRQVENSFVGYRLAVPSGEAPREQFQTTAPQALNLQGQLVYRMVLDHAAPGSQVQVRLEKRGLEDLAGPITGFPQISLENVADQFQNLLDRGNSAALMAAGAMLPPTMTAALSDRGWLRAGLKLNPASPEFIKRGDHVVPDLRPADAPRPGQSFSGYVGSLEAQSGGIIARLHQKPDLSDASAAVNLLWIAKDGATKAVPVPPAHPTPAAAAQNGQPSVAKAGETTQAPAAAPAPAAEAKPLTLEERLKLVDARLKKIDAMTGLEDVKGQVHTMVNVLVNRARREAKGLKNPVVSNHMVALGPAGTGKTTILRELALIMKDLGILDKGHLVEVTRADLVAEFEGQTAGKTRNKVKEAFGGLLLIDEAYSLCRGPNDMYGQESIAELLKIMEDDRDKFVGALAGYDDEMQAFLASNSGFESRISKRMKFKSYTTPQLVDIFKEKCEQGDYKLAEEPTEPGVKSPKAVVAKLLDDTRAYLGRRFANGRTARTIFEKALENQANRFAHETRDMSADELRTLTVEDLESIKPQDLGSEEKAKGSEAKAASSSSGDVPDERLVQEVLQRVLLTLVPAFAAPGVTTEATSGQ
ncbi:MAG TPA: AAA family ATPase [Candidatus Xenobia bacterium]|jgi:hypothetical protein